MKKCGDHENGISTTLVILTSLLVMLGVSYYQQYVVGDVPCLLCSAQRFCLWGVVLALCAVLCRRTRWVWWSAHAVIVLFTLVGMLAVSRQLWLQYAGGPNGSACLPGFETLMHTMPWHQAVLLLLRESAGCAQIPWYFLGVNATLWMLAVFFGLLVYVSIVVKERSSR
jgi:disulfide bond formation protein DsbB